MTKTNTRLGRIASETLVSRWFYHLALMLEGHVFGILNLGHWNLFDI